MKLIGDIDIRRKTTILIGALLATLLIAYVPIISKTTTAMIEVTVPNLNSPIMKQTLDLNIPLTSTTFHIQTLTLTHDQRANITIQSTTETDLVALLSNSSTEAFIQTLISEIGVPIGPTLFTGKDLTPTITTMIREKLPTIMGKTSHSDYYKINQRDDATSLTLKAGRYNLITLCLNHTGDLHITIEYRSTDSVTEFKPITTTERVSILSWIRAQAGV
jgi:hypothetical protein